jgi:hypothetical protein
MSKHTLWLPCGSLADAEGHDYGCVPAMTVSVIVEV